MSVILYEDAVTAAETKFRRITIHKDEVYKDIDNITYKYMEAKQLPSVQQGNAISSDVTEHLDGNVIARLVEFREAQLRQKISFALKEETTRADDTMHLVPDFEYYLYVPSTFNDSLLKPMATYFHRFLVWGALHDWYMELGISDQASAYARQLDDLEDIVSSALRGGSIAKRPMQPFGPAKRLY